MSSLFLKARQALYDSHYITPEQLKTNPRAKEIIFSTLCAMGYNGIPENFSKIKNQSRFQYGRTGYKVAHSLLQLQRERGGRIQSIVLELGERDLYSLDTVNHSKELIQELLGDLPHYAKVERLNSRESLIHVHVCALIPDGLDIPVTVQKTPVKLIPLGTGQYAHKSTHDNVCSFIGYLLKPADARSNRKNKANRQQMYLEWFLEMEAQTYGLGTWEDVPLRWGKNLGRAWERYEHISTTADPTPTKTPPTKINSTPVVAPLLDITAELVEILLTNHISTTVTPPTYSLRPTGASSPSAAQPPWGAVKAYGGCVLVA